MKSVAIIGASVSSHNVALRLREKCPDCRITLISEEDCLAYDHLKLADLISGVITEEQLFLCAEGLYREQKIDFLKGKKVSGLNTQKKLIYFKEKGNLSYDYLVIASGRSPTLPEIPGAKKKGVFRLYTLEDAREFLRHYISEPVCVAGSDAFALKVSEAIVEKYKVEVKLLTPKAFAPGSIPKNVEVIHDPLQEIIGEGEAQAVKLKSGKAISVSAVLFMDDYRPNADFLKNTDVAVKDGLVAIDGWMQTAVKDVFACGSIIGKDSVVIGMILVDNIIRQMKGETCQTS